MEYIIKSEKELIPIATKLIELSKQQKIITFTGDLGAGKTTLIKEICKQLHVTDTVSSPTFGLVNIYRTINNSEIYHFDCYRINDISEVYEVGFEEYIDSGNLCLIEWPQVIEPLLPKKKIAVTIALQKNLSRIIKIE